MSSVCQLNWPAASTNYPLIAAAYRDDLRRPSQGLRSCESHRYRETSLQNWFALSGLAEPIPDETTVLNFRHLLEVNDLAEDILKAVNAHLARKGLLLKRGSIVDATIVAARRLASIHLPTMHWRGFR